MKRSAPDEGCRPFFIQMFTLSHYVERLVLLPVQISYSRTCNRGFEGVRRCMLVSISWSSTSCPNRCFRKYRRCWWERTFSMCSLWWCPVCSFSRKKRSISIAWSEDKDRMKSVSSMISVGKLREFYDQVTDEEDSPILVFAELEWKNPAGSRIVEPKYLSIFALYIIMYKGKQIWKTRKTTNCR